MIKKEILKSSGQIARTLLALAVIVLVAVIIAYVVVSRTKPPAPPPVEEEEVKPVYNVEVGGIKFYFLDATDKGNTLFARDSSQPTWIKDLKTTERFVILDVGAQNIGKENTRENIWDVGQIVDSEGRKYDSSDENLVRYWMPEIDLCGSILKPSFEPTHCIKIYEVAKVAEGLKVNVYVYDEPGSDKGQVGTIDIRLMP